MHSSHDGRRLVLVVLAMLALGAAAAAVAGSSRAVTWMLVALVVEYGVARAGRSGIDPWAPLLGAGLLVLGELADAAAGRFGYRDREVRATARVTAAGAVALGGAIGGWAVLAVAAWAPMVPAHEVVGVAAAIAAVGILARLVRRMWARGAGAPR